MSKSGEHSNDTGHNSEAEDHNIPTIDVTQLTRNDNRERSTSESSQSTERENPARPLRRRSSEGDVRELHLRRQAGNSNLRGLYDNPAGTSQPEQSSVSDTSRLHPDDQIRGRLLRREGSRELRDLSADHERNARGWAELRQRLSERPASSGGQQQERSDLLSPYNRTAPGESTHMRSLSESGLGRSSARNPEGQPPGRPFRESDLREPSVQDSMQEEHPASPGEQQPEAPPTYLQATSAERRLNESDLAQYDYYSQEKSANSAQGEHPKASSEPQLPLVVCQSSFDR